jgi:hypothetical protein
MTSGNQVTTSGFVLAADVGQASWLPDSLTGPQAGGDLYATPPAAGPAPAVWWQPPAAECDCHGGQPPAKRGRGCPPMRQVRDPAVIGRRGS